jgi:hypothetical protein
MSGKKFVGCLGMVLLLVGCGGMETDEVQYRVVPPEVSINQVDLHDSLLFHPVLNTKVKIRVDNTDPTVKRPDSTLVRPKQRPPKPVFELLDDDIQRDLVRCGENWVDIFSDPEHCGACFNSCATSDCVEGACVPGH